MKKIISTLLALIVATTMATAQTTLKFAFEDKEDFPSVLGTGPDVLATNPGASVEILRLIEKKLGIAINLSRYPWTRALEAELAGGTIDGLLTASYKKEREAWGMYPMAGDKPDTTKSLYVTNYVFYRLKGSSIDWTGTALIKSTGSVSIPRGYSVVEELKALGYKVEETDGTLTCLKMLAAGRAGSVLTLELSADALLAASPDLAKVIEKVAIPYASKPYYIMLSKQFVQKNPELAKKIWASVGELQGEYKKIAAKYIK